MKKVYLIHGWEGYPNNCWFPWLKKELEKRGLEVHAFSMPNPNNPDTDEWINFLEKNLKGADKDTYLIGHSMGCRAIIGFLEKTDKKIGGVIFVAGWIALTNLETDEEKRIANQWTSRKVDFKKVKKMSKKFIALFSDNDPYVPLKENIKVYKEKLGAEIIIENGKGHFSDDAGIKELSVVLNELLKMVNLK